jgi:hypothetical protein
MGFDAIGRLDLARDEEVTEATSLKVFCFLLVEDLEVESTRNSETGSSSRGRLTRRRTPSCVVSVCLMLILQIENGRRMKKKDIKKEMQYCNRGYCLYFTHKMRSIRTRIWR